MPLNRQRDRYAREGVDLSLSTLADQVGTCAVALKPLHDLIAAHVLAASRLHGDDAPFGGPDPPAALFRYARDRSGEHPVEHLQTFAGILQADAYAGYRRLYAAGRSPGPVIEALCRVGGVVAEPLPSQTRTSRFPASGSSHASFAHGACNL